MDADLDELMKQLERQPDAVDTWIEMARALHALGRAEDALLAAKKATELGPTNAPAWRLAGVYGAQLGFVRHPVECLQTAAGLEPGNAENWVLLGQACLASGDLDGAERALRRSRAVDPRHAGGASALAKVRIRQGRLHEAEALLLPVLKGRSANVAMAWSLLHRKNPRRALGPLVEASEYATGFTRTRLLHELGNTYDALGETEKAFAAYEVANATRRAPFDPDAYDAMVDAAIRDWTVVRCRPAVASRTPVVWIVGLPRSGTSLLEQMLGAHPDIHPGGELQFLGNTEFRRQAGRPDEALAEDLRTAYAELSEGLGWVTDKMPDNLLRLGLASRLAPGSVVVSIRRDPLDTLWSCYRQCFGDGLAWTTRLDWLARVYAAQMRLLEHYREVGSLDWVDVDYATLVSDPETAIRRILGKLGLGLDARCLTPHRQTRTVATASVDEVRSPIHGRSVGRAEPYRDHLQPLLDALAVS
ncbi:MAG: sulfotransferase [Myxococcota bacterium]